MLGAVQLHHDFRLVAVKIRDVISNHILPVKPGLVTAQKLIPKVRFFLGHLLSETSGIPGQFFISFHNPTFLQVC